MGVEHPRAAVWEVGFDGVVLEWSSGAERLWEIDRGDAISHRYEDLADWGTGPWMLDEFRSMSEGDVWVYRHTVTTKSGRAVPVRTVAAVNYDRGDFGLTFCATREHYVSSLDPDRSRPIKSILGQTQKLYLCDDAGLVTHVGPSIHGCLGYRRHELLGRPIDEFLSGHDRLAWDEMWEWALTRPGRTQSVVARGRDATGHMHWIEFNATSYLHYPDIGSVVVFWRDLEEDRRSVISELIRAS